MKKFLGFIDLLVASLFIFSSLHVGAQNYHISGYIQDTNDEAIGLASVALSSHTGEVVDGIFSEDNGNFKLSAMEGEYILSISFIGYKDHRDTLQISDDKELGKIILESDHLLLDQVLVSDFRNEMSAGIDKRVVHISDDLRRSNSSLSELLELVPLVNMDIDGNPSIPGKRGVVVLIDGRRPKIRANDLATVLKAIPTDQIKSIEIMTNPPAKYTRSNAAVINVVTNKFELDGYVLNLRVNTDSENNIGYGGSYIHKKGKFASNAWLGNWNWVSESTETTVATNNLSTSRNRIERKRVSKFDGGVGYFGFAPEYEINKRNTISLNIGGWFHNGTPSSSNQTKIYDALGNLQEDYLVMSNSDNKGGAYYGGIEYFRTFAQKERELTAELQWSVPINENTSHQEAIESNNIAIQETQNDRTGNELEGNIEYFHPLDSSSSINFELELEYSPPQDDNLTTFLGDNNSLQKYEPLSFENTLEDFYQAFTISYSKKIKSYTIGLDVGQEYLKFNHIYDNNKKYDKDFIFITPAFRLSKKLSKRSEIGISYKYVQDAPRERHVNQNERVSVDELEKDIGNIKLDPEKSHDIELNHSFFMGKFNFGSTAFVRINDDNINFFTEALDDGTYLSTYKNNGQLINSGVQVSISGDIKRKLRISANGSIFDSRLKQDNGENRRTTGYNINTNFTWILPANIRLGFRLRYTGPSLHIQGEESGFYTISSDIRKTYFKKRLNISLSFRDILQSVEIKSSIREENFLVETTRLRRRPWFRLRVSYRLGELKEKTKSSKGREQTQG